jgi:hypothetical protein
MDSSDVEVKKEIKDENIQLLEFKNDIEIKEEVPVPKSYSTDNGVMIKKSYPVYCTLCQVTLLLIADHVNGKKHKKKLEIHKSREMAEMNSDNFIMPKGTIMFIDGFKNTTTKEDIKEAFMVTFDVKGQLITEGNFVAFKIKSLKQQNFF